MGFLHFDFMSEKLRYHTNLYLILPEETRRAQEPEATLYLLHGGGGNGMDWLRYTSIERFAQERRIAVVMPEVDGTCFYADMKYGYPYFTFLTKEIPALTETLFPVNRKRRQRYVAGLSMGGYGAWKWAFHEPQFFGAAANLSGISFITEIFKEGGFAQQEREGENGLVAQNWGSLEELQGSESDSAKWLEWASERKVELPALYAGIGTEDFSYPDACKYLEACGKIGLKVEQRMVPGRHEWSVWDKLIADFMDWAKGHAQS